MKAEKQIEYWLGVEAYVNYTVKKKYPHLPQEVLNKVTEVEVKQFKKYLTDCHKKELDKC